MDKNFNQNPNFGQNQNVNQNFNQNPNFNQYRNYGYVTTMRSNSSKQRIRSLILLICFTLTILITSVYAWFSTQKNVSLNNIKGKVEVAEGLQISIDAETWEQEIIFGKDTTPTTASDKKASNGIISTWTSYDIGTNSTTSNNIRPFSNTVTWNRGTTSDDSTTGYMLPVSCAGLIDSTSKTLTFYSGTYAGTKIQKIYQQQEVMEAGFYAFDAYLMNTTKGNAQDALYLNQDSVVREIRTGTNTDYGLKNCVRVGLAFYDDGGTVTDNDSQVIGVSSQKNEILDKLEKNHSIIKKVAIWEPNFDEHSEYVMKQNSRLDSLAQNATKQNGVATNAIGLNTYAISSIPPGTNLISNVYDKTSTGLTETKTMQTTGKVVTAQDENGNDIVANDSGVLPLVDLSGNAIKLTANSISKVRVYIWIEGQDPDCINWASHSDGIDVTVGLIKTSAGKKFKVDTSGTKITQYETENL